MRELSERALVKEKIRRLRGPLLRWYRKHRRDLPWRATRNPYAIWVSEIMLQQTQVTTVLPYYHGFMKRFPDVCTLAEAPEEAVLSAWSGLGYYRRARSLHAAARAVVERHKGRVPEGPDELRSLPGVGRYTAGAICSMAYGKEEPALDGNVKRVLSRLLAIRHPSERQLWEIAQRLVHGRDPGNLNQALMELGALVCTPRSPRCPNCPVRSGCRALAQGSPETFPVPRPSRRPERVRVAVAVAWRNGRVLLERPGESSPFRGTWDLPALEIPREADPRRAIARELESRHGLTLEVQEQVRHATHSILHRRLCLEAFGCRLLRGRPSEHSELRWVRPEHIPEIPVSGATRKLLDAAS